MAFRPQLAPGWRDEVCLSCKVLCWVMLLVLGSTCTPAPALCHLRFYTPVKWTQKESGGLLEIYKRDLFKALGLCKQGTQVGKNQTCSKEERKIFIVKSTLLRIISPAFLALGLVQNRYQSGVRQWGWWMPGHLEDGDQEVRSGPGGLDNGSQVAVCVGLWGWPGGPDVHTGLGGSKKFKFPGQLE